MMIFINELANKYFPNSDKEKGFINFTNRYEKTVDKSFISGEYEKLIKFLNLCKNDDGFLNYAKSYKQSVYIGHIINQYI